MSAAIEVEHLRKEFPGGVVAVDGIDLAMPEGEMFGFLGPNGAGKSTTVRILTTLMRPTSGRARVAGLDLASQAHEIRRRIGVALQDAGLDGMAKGRELLELQARLYGFRGREPARRALRMLELVGLTDAAERLVKTYSGGMKRRLDLASALIHGPSILFLDEPTAGLDPASREAIWEEVRRLNKEEGITVFLTTQYLEEADRLADRVAIIDHGRIVAEGTPHHLKRSVGADMITIELSGRALARARKTLEACEGVVEVRPNGSALQVFAEDGAAVAPRAVAALAQANVGVSSIRVEHPTLDQVFLRATGGRLEGAGGAADGAASPGGDGAAAGRGRAASGKRGR